MSDSKKPPPSDGQLEEEVEYVQGEDDEDDEEDDFIPGVEDDEDIDEEEIVPLFDGTLDIDHENILHYRGDGFHLASTRAVEWNVLDRNVKPKSSIYTFEMEGDCDIETASGKPTFRKLEVTWRVEDGTSSLNGNRPSRLREKADPNEEKTEDAKMPSLSYNVYGRQIDCSKGENLEFRGSYPPSNGKEVGLCVQVRLVPSVPVAAAAAAKPAVAAAARVDSEDPDEEEEEEEADDGVDYEELIALHEDAGMSVADLQKRYRGNEKMESTSPRKKGKSMPDDDDDDDSDYGF